MSCGTCRNVKEGAQMLYTTEHTRIEGRDGRIRNITSPLFEPARAPRGGWSVSFDINGQRMVFPGSSGHNVFVAVKRVLDSNAIKIRDLDIWLNLNIVWLGRAIDKYQMVTLGRLMDLVTVNHAGDDRVRLTNPPVPE